MAKKPKLSPLEFEVQQYIKFLQKGGYTPAEKRIAEKRLFDQGIPAENIRAIDDKLGVGVKKGPAPRPLSYEGEDQNVPAPKETPKAPKETPQLPGVPQKKALPKAPEKLYPTEAARVPNTQGVTVSATKKSKNMLSSISKGGEEAVSLVDLPKTKDLRQAIRVLRNKAQALAAAGDRKEALANTKTADALETQLNESAGVDALFNKADPRKNPIAGATGEVRAVSKVGSATTATTKRESALTKISQAVKNKFAKSNSYGSAIGPEPIGPYAQEIGPEMAMGGEAAAGAGAAESLAAKVGGAAAKSKGGLGLLGKIGGWPTVAAMALPLVAEHLPGIVDGAKDRFGPLLGHDFAADKLQRVLDAQDQISRFTRAQQRRQQDLEQLVNVNTQMLAQNAPQLFNQIMAGRELPDGATVIGGQPRTDLMREVAMQMSQGGFQQQQQGGQPNGNF